MPANPVHTYTALEAPIRPTQPIRLTGDTGLTVVPDRSDQSSGKISLWFLMTKMRWRIGESLWLIIYKVLTSSVDRKVRLWALKFVLDDGELYRRPADDFLFKCLGLDQVRLAMAEVHEGICGTHQSAPKMKWLLRRACFYWPAMIADCFWYYKGCEECRKHRDVQLVLAALMHLIILPWPFRGWGLDFIGKIHPPSSKGYCFVIVATDYFTKWTEAIPLKNMTHREAIEFITGHIIHRFGIPQTLTTNQVTSFISKVVREFVNSYGIKLLNSFPYYARANGHAESSNKTLVKLIKKKIEDNPRRWHEVLSEALWLIVFLDMVLPKLLPLSLCMVNRSFCLLR
jgi:hypothetical protein